MDGLTELAKQIRKRDNPAGYTPMIGTIIGLPELKIKLGNRILLDANDVKSIFDIAEKIYDEEGRFLRYENLGKEVVLLPYSNDKKYIAIGVILE